MTERRIEEQVKELQAHNTKLETERRMWKARYTATKQVLDVVLTDSSIIGRLSGREDDEALQELLGVSKALHARIDLLEKDAWSQCAAVAREFVNDPVVQTALASEFVHAWAEKFKKALGD